MKTPATAAKKAVKEPDYAIPHEALQKLARLRRGYLAELRELALAATGAMQPGCEGKREIIESGEAPNIRQRNVRGDPLDLMRHKKQLSFRQWAAGDRFRADWLAGQISPHRTVDFERLDLSVPGGGGIGGNGWPIRRPRKVKGSWRDLAPAVLDAQNHLKNVAAKLEPEYYQLLEKLCGQGLFIRDIVDMGGHGKRNRVGKQVRAALTALAKYYGYTFEDPGEDLV